MANGVPVQVPTPASTGTTGAAAAQPPPPNRVALVMVPSSALQGYMIHATTTAHEEVMGLILGDWIDIPPTSMEDTATPESIADVMCFLVQRRLDKRPDRVELAPEQLIEAAAHAEQLSVTTGKRVRVIGWYHSHPNITVQPSHVDVGTQRTQQLMDGRFIGLIMSVFHSDHSTHAQQQRLIAFQTNNMVNTFLPIPISVYYDPISPPTAAMLASVPRTLYGELVDEHDRLVGAGTAADTGTAVGPAQRLMTGLHHVAELANLHDKVISPVLEVARYHSERKAAGSSPNTRSDPSHDLISF